MDDPFYGPIDDDIYRSIAASAGPTHARFLYDLALVAVNFEEKPEQLDHLIHKWALTEGDLASAKAFIADFRAQS